MAFTVFSNDPAIIPDANQVFDFNTRTDGTSHLNVIPAANQFSGPVTTAVMVVVSMDWKGRTGCFYRKSRPHWTKLCSLQTSTRPFGISLLGAYFIFRNKIIIQ